MKIREVITENEQRVKYPRTYHFPWSQAVTDDDKMHSSLTQFTNLDVVVTEKMDGENTTMYSDYIHARSIDSRNHPSRDWSRAFHAQICSDIPEGWRVCGENLFATHSVAYDSLKSYFYGFSMWDDTNTMISWDDTIEWFSLLGITPVPVLFRGKYEDFNHDTVWKSISSRSEGYVLRFAGRVPYAHFNRLVGKFVRENHVQTDTHWMNAEIKPNKLA